MFSKTSLADKILASDPHWYENTGGTTPGQWLYDPANNCIKFIPYKEEDVPKKLYEKVGTPLPMEVFLEKDVCKALRTYWKANGYFYIRNQQGLGSKRGTSDYTVVKNGYTAFVEAKATNGKQSPYQKLFQEELERAHGAYLLVHSLEEFMELWKERGNGGL